MGVAAGVVGGWFDIVITTWQWGPFMTEEDEGKARPFVKDPRVLLFYFNRPIFVITWTGDTHEETNVLPSNRWGEGGQCWSSSSWQNT